MFATYIEQLHAKQVSTPFLRLTYHPGRTHAVQAFYSPSVQLLDPD